jgi:TonB family protein
MSRILSGLLLLGLAFGTNASPSGWAQDKPAKAPQSLPGQKGGSASSEPEAAAVAVEIAKAIPPADRDNLKHYWAGVQSRTGQQWLRVRAAKTAADAVKITCWIHTDGRVTGLAVEHGSGNAVVDRAARAAIAESAPYDPFPYGIAVDQVKVRFTFGSSAPPPPGVPAGPVH